MVTSAIEARRLGRSSMTVPRVMLGCGAFGGIGSTPELFGKGLDDDDAFELMDAAWEAGITHFDTADAYGGGRSEQAIGRWIRARGVRPGLTTKTFNPMDAGADQGLSAARIRRQLHSSLERLGVSKVDLYLAHDFDPDVPLEETIGTLEELQREGLLTAHGVSNFSAAQLESAAALGATQCVQNSRSLLDQAAEDVLDVCARRDIAFLAYGPLAGGWLTGKYRGGEPFPAGSRMTQRPEPYRAFINDSVFDGLDRLGRAAAERGISMAGLSLAWLLADPRVAAVVVGPGRPEQLDPVREALGCELTPSQRDALSGVFA